MNDLYTFLLSAADSTPDTEERREYGRIIGFLRDGKISRRACEAALASHLSQAHAWQQVLTFMKQPVQEPAREMEEVAS
jgi:hypothetical protein